MSKYNKFARNNEPARPKVHPIWTGIGCLMIIIVPIISGAGAQQLMDFGYSQGWPVMGSLSGNVNFPAEVYTLPLISVAATYISSIQNLPGLALFFLIILLILSGVLTFGYAILYRVVGPPRYTSEDAPAQRHVSVKKYKR